MIGELGPDAIDVILHHQLIGQIGCHADDVTYIVPISYAYRNNYIYAFSQEGMKINMMRQNPKVCFQVYTMENMANWQSVVVWGDFEELTGDPDREDAIRILLNRSLPTITGEKTRLTPHRINALEKDLGKNVKGIVFRIKIDKKTGRYENREVIPY